MIFSTKAGYSLRAMVQLAKNYRKKALSLAKIAQTEHISLGYLERLIKPLKKADLVVSVIGSAGGYKLSRDPKKITVAQVVAAAEGALTNFYCISTNKKIMRCPAACLTKKVWYKLNKQIKKTLESITLNSLVK